MKKNENYKYARLLKENANGKSVIRGTCKETYLKENANVRGWEEKIPLSRESNGRQVDLHFCK